MSFTRSNGGDEESAWRLSRRPDFLEDVLTKTGWLNTSELDDPRSTATGLLT